MENKKDIIEKIRKVLALAENNPNENEAIAAALKAQKLMAKFHIDEKEIGQEVTEDNIDKLICKVSGKTQKWRLQLASILANNFRCKVYLLGSDVVFYGYESDIKICSEVFYSLYRIGVKLSDKAKRDARSRYGTATGVRNTFCLGFVHGIKNELEKQCTALMIVVPKEVNESFDNLKNEKNMKQKNASIKATNRAIYDKGFQSGKDAIRSRGIEGSH